MDILPQREEQGYRVLVMLAHLPIVLVGAPFGWPSVSYLDHLD
jgi:hypothetical protein